MASKACSKMVASIGFVSLLAVVTVTAAWAAIEGQGQCSSKHGDCHHVAEGATTSSPVAEEDQQASAPAPASAEEVDLELLQEVPRLGYAKLAVLLGFCLFMILWIFLTLKWAWDGSLPARLAIWGLLPEAYAAITVRAVVALLRLKSSTTPVVLLRACITDESSQELGEAIRLYGKKADLVSLEIPYNHNMGAKGLGVIVESILQAELPLEELDLSYNPQLGDVAFEVLGPMLDRKISKLNTIRLQGCDVTVASLEKLCAGGRAERLRLTLLDLSGSKLTGAGEIFAEMMGMPIIEELALACCSLTCDDVKAIAEQLPYSNLRALQLAGNELRKEQLLALSEELPSCHLDELGLEGNELKAEDLSCLATAWVKRPFSRLKLSGNLMTQQEIANFVLTLRSMQ